MFLQVCVILFTGGGVCVSQHALQEVSQHALQQVSRGMCIPACLAAGLRGVCPSMHCRRYPSMPCSRSPGDVSQHALQEVSQRPVRILLECILVYFCNHSKIEPWFYLTASSALCTLACTDPNMSDPILFNNRVSRTYNQSCSSFRCTATKSINVSKNIPNT